MAILHVSDLPITFSDITLEPDPPLDQFVCEIDYNSDYALAMRYFYHCLHQTKELSERVFDLTTFCLRFNPAHYTVWKYRRDNFWKLFNNSSEDDDDDSLDSLEVCVSRELEFTNRIGGSNCKNYQVWHHRRALLQPLFSLSKQPRRLRAIAQKELQAISSTLYEDAKNYHAWANRQFVLNQLQLAFRRNNNIEIDDQLWSEETSFINMLLIKDIRNNSAWNHRWFVVRNKCHPNSENKIHTFNQEMNYALGKIELDPYNESPLRYLVGTLKDFQNIYSNKQEETEKWITKILKDFDDIMRDFEDCKQLLASLVDILQLSQDIEKKRTAKAICQKLCEMDKTRFKFWKYRMKILDSAVQN